MLKWSRSGKKMDYEKKNCQGVPKKFKLSYNGYHVENNLLMYSPHLTQSHPALVVPKSCSTQILEMFHDDTDRIRHPGEIETYLPVRTSMVLLGSMRQDTANYVRTCSICACTTTRLTAVCEGDGNNSLVKSSHLT